MIKEDSWGNLFLCNLNYITWKKTYIFIYMAPEFWCPKVQFSCSVVSDSLWSHEPQHARPPCPSRTPRVYQNPRPLCRWCHPIISSSAIPFSSCLQSFPASGSFQMSQLSASGGQSIGVTQYVSKFGKLSSDHRTGKGQFSFQSQRKVMPKNAQRLHTYIKGVSVCYSKDGSNNQVFHITRSLLDIRIFLSWRLLLEEHIFSLQEIVQGFLHWEVLQIQLCTVFYFQKLPVNHTYMIQNTLENKNVYIWTKFFNLQLLHYPFFRLIN